MHFFHFYSWGRPDMAIFSFTKKILGNETIDVFNNGDMMRDFTFVDDIVAVRCFFSSSLLLLPRFELRVEFLKHLKMLV